MQNPEQHLEHNKNHICNSILMAEDNLSIMRLYKRNLKKMQVPLHDFSNGQECYEFITKSGILECKMCNKILIFSDLHMPFMNGIELAKKVRMLHTTKEVKMVLVTADDIQYNTH